MSLLARLADDMRRDVRPGRASERTLPHGLCLMLAVVNGRYWLHLWRDAATPSDREIAIVRSAFAIPDGAPQRWSGQRYIVHWPVCDTSERTPARCSPPAAPIRNAVPVVVGVVGTPIPMANARRRSGLDPDDPWLRLQHQLADRAERRGDHDRAAHYRQLLADEEPA